MSVRTDPSSAETDPAAVAAMVLETALKSGFAIGMTPDGTTAWLIPEEAVWGEKLSSKRHGPFASPLEMLGFVHGWIAYRDAVSGTAGDPDRGLN